jgi:hypothetical protein
VEECFLERLACKYVEKNKTIALVRDWVTQLVGTQLFLDKIQFKSCGKFNTFKVVVLANENQSGSILRHLFLRFRAFLVQDDLKELEVFFLK